MLNIRVEVFEDRNFVGTLTLTKGGRDYTFDVSSKADPTRKALDPATGGYTLTKIADVSAEGEEAIAAYGPVILFFEETSPKGGAPKKILALHGGNTDVSGDLLPTEGSLRIRDNDLGTLVNLLKSDPDVRIAVVETKLGLFRRFTASRVSKASLPRVSFSGSQAPKQIHYHYYSSSPGVFDNPFFWLWLYDRDDRTVAYQTVVENNTFVPGGGASGGAGASGSFDDPVAGATGTPVPDVEATRDEGDLPLIVDPFQNQGHSHGEAAIQAETSTFVPLDARESAAERDRVVEDAPVEAETKTFESVDASAAASGEAQQSGTAY